MSAYSLKHIDIHKKSEAGLYCPASLNIISTILHFDQAFQKRIVSISQKRFSF